MLGTEDIQGEKKKDMRKNGTSRQEDVWCPRVSKRGLPVVYRSSKETVGALLETAESER